MRSNVELSPFLKIFLPTLSYNSNILHLSQKLKFTDLRALLAYFQYGFSGIL